MKLKTLQYLSVSVLLLAVLIAVLFETETLETGLLAANETWMYLADMVGVVLTLICIPLGMKLKKHRAVRLGLFSLVILYSLLVYYLFFSSTTLACCAIGVVVMLLQWPTEKTVEIWSD